MPTVCFGPEFGRVNVLGGVWMENPGETRLKISWENFIEEVFGKYCG